MPLAPELPPLKRRRQRALAALALAVLVGGACQARPPTAGTASPPNEPTAPAASATTATTRPAAPAPAARFDATPEVAALTATMTEEGKRLFYGARPEVLDKAPFALVCPGGSEQGQVLGCYTGDRIYILRVARPELTGVMETTAVHEMLHAAYAALSSRDRSLVDTWVGDFYAGVKDRDLRELVAAYDRSEPGQRLNELHSILPTQLPSLSAPLENQYRRYLASRQRVVALYQGYRGTLEELDRRISSLHEEIDDAKAQIKVMEERLRGDEAALEELNRRLEALRAAGKVEEFNRLIPQQNAQVDALRSLGDRYRQLVKAHNAKVQEVNDLALQQNQLVESLGGG